jgi:hypothetical protein
MTAKRAPEDELRYSSDELEPRDWAGEDAFADDFIVRNRAALNEALEEGYRSLQEGEPTALADVLAEIEARKRSRKS